MIRITHGLAKKLTSLALVTMLSACGGSDSSDGSGGGVLTNNKASIGYINATDIPVSFYGKNTSITTSLYHDDNLTVTLLEQQSSENLPHRWLGNSVSDFGVREANYRSKSATLSSTLADKQNYWLIAWLNGNSFALNQLIKTSDNQDGVYRVRLFSNSVQNVYVNGNTSAELTVQKGQVSQYVTVNDCTALMVGDNEIDLCQSGNLGRSYLAVVNEQGLLVLVEEG